MGQGAGLALANAVDLSRALDRASDVSEALHDWDRRNRRIAHAVQRWSINYGRAVEGWPAPLLRWRAPVIRAVLAAGPVRRRYLHLQRGGVAPRPWGPSSEGLQPS
jgi:2-polyprenyl-6-methoxyphenol hydroxylase-like FAD-dependent oxidoreductase